MAEWVDEPRLRDANTVLEAYEIAGAPLAQAIATRAAAQVAELAGPEVATDVVVIDRSGQVLAQCS